MQMVLEKPDPPVFSYKFQGIFNASVFSELALHTETKMTIFMSGWLEGLSLIFSKFWIQLVRSHKGGGDD